MYNFVNDGHFNSVDIFLELCRHKFLVDVLINSTEALVFKHMGLVRFFYKCSAIV